VKLSIEGLRFAYHRHEVLRGVELSADAGQLVCVLGENGAGKTTLFRCLLGLLDGYAGQIRLDGDDTGRMTAREMALRIAYVPQAGAPAFNYTVFDTVLMGTNVLTPGLTTPGASQRDIAAQTLELLGIAELGSRGYAELSGGERQLVLIARALAQRSGVLVMDEPTASLDYGNQFRVMRQVKSLAEAGYLVLVSTHSPEQALRYADAVAVLRDGVVEASGAPGDVLTPAMIQRVYGVTAELHDVRTSWGDVPVVVPRFR